jgi:tripartite-type tricarboxylate transporter receptor subunit TctC
MIRTFLTRLTAVAALVALAVAAMPAQAQDTKGFYKGKVGKIVVGYGPGGGYDAYARMIAPHLEKTTGARWIVENQPGAGGVTALNRIATASPDGLQMMIVNGTGAALGQILDQKAIRYDLAKLNYLGIVSSSPWIWIASPKAKINSAADAMKAGVTVNWAASGVTDGLGDGAALTCATLKLSCRIVRGYKGSKAAALAVTQGEMDSLYVSDTSAYNYVRSKGAKAIATMSREKSRFFKDLPTIFEQVKLTPDQAWWFDFRATLDDLGRILVTTPGVPADRLAFLQNAVKTTLTDPGLIAEGEKTNRYIAFQDAEATRKKVMSVVASLTPAQKKQAQTIILGK